MSIYIRFHITFTSVNVRCPLKTKMQCRTCKACFTLILKPFDRAFLAQSCDLVLKPVSHQPCGSRAPICDDKFIGFVRQPHGVVNNTARLPYEKQGRKAAATNFRHVHFLCDLFAFSERRTTAARHTRLSQDCCKTRKVFVQLTL